MSGVLFCGRLFPRNELSILGAPIAVKALHLTGRTLSPKIYYAEQLPETASNDGR